jgi:hypothetical protein|tara:strand:- start:3638 stop:3826 length:189 start_codon:yes stop_codon:yes gene_type:complete
MILYIVAYFAMDPLFKIVNAASCKYRNGYKSPCNPEFKRVGKRLAFKVLNTGKSSGQQGKCD